jgi:hypothetical protein
MIFDTSENEDSKLSCLESDLILAIEQHWHLANLKFCKSFLMAVQKSEQAHHTCLSSWSRETRSLSTAAGSDVWRYTVDLLLGHRSSMDCNYFSMYSSIFQGSYYKCSIALFPEWH